MNCQNQISSAITAMRVIPFWKSILLAITSVLLLGVQTTLGADSEPRSGAQLTLLHSDSQSILVELVVTDYQLETVEHSGGAYQRVMVPGTYQTEQPGKPQMPTL